ncbi:flagellar basal body [Micractinium conductrix]|uniref:Flagellar basal body n=1 Tax=Micractinium conductrix TaxID=554055 RepID=A0A2P6VR59_9CHLO|nr:flagellar basal body [Micractinium conductrix]|eukprot:PSC76586.1 flagellar basal body [Micractinium conductrix]
MSAAARSKRPSGRAGAREPPPDEAEDQALDVEAMLQAERAKQALSQLEAAQAAYDELAAEHRALQERRRHEEREARELAALFRREVAAKAEALAAAQAQLAAGGSALEAAQAAAMHREAELRTAFEAERQALADAAAALQAQLDALADWRQQKESTTAESQRLHAENGRLAEAAGEKVRALQRRLYELGHGHDGEGADGEVPRSGHGPRPGSSASEGGGGDVSLEADLHRVLVHSRRVEDEMRHYGQEAEELQREMQALEGERAALLRDAALAGEMEAQYAKRGTLQAREIRDQKSKISTLEKGLARMAADFEAEKAALQAGLRAQLADAAAEQHALRRLLQVRTKELRQVRRLAQEVLLQRSDVEAFLVSSIQQVRAEMAAEAAAAAAGTAAPQQAPGEGGAEGAREAALAAGTSGGSDTSSSSLGMAGERSIAASVLAGSIGGAAAGGGASTAPGVGPMDIQQLSWQDRERILRLLFAKINRSAAASQRPVVPAMARTQALSEAQAEAPPSLPALRGLATEAGPAGLA